MKYIRTDNTNFIYKFNDDADYMQYDNIKGHIVRVADTIEELCDGYMVYIECQFNKSLIFDNYKLDFERFKYVLNWEKSKYLCDVIGYGFVKTDKGLIYVAKLNDKGELELIWKH